MTTENRAADALDRLSKQLRGSAPPTLSQSAAVVDEVADAVRSLGYRLDAVELVAATLARKAGLTESQIHRSEMRALEGPMKDRHDVVTLHLERLLKLGDG